MRRLLLLPFLAPLLAALVVAGLNPRPAVSLRLLTWQTPPQPLGVWIAALALGGAAVSGGATALALREASPALRRRLRRESGAAWEGGVDGERWTGGGREGPVREWDREPIRGGRAAAADPFRGPRQADDGADAWQSAPAGRRETPSAGPSRAPGEPPPTVSVPYRVIRRAEGGRSAPAAGAAAATATARSAAEERVGLQNEPVPVQDDWQQSGFEDW